MNKQYKLNQLHLFEKRGSHFVFDTVNLRLYLVDDEFAGILKDMQTQYGYNKAFTMEDDSIIDELLDEEMAVMVEENQEDELSELKTDPMDDKKKLIISNITLQLANDCNLNCLYCYGDGGAFGRKREIMDFETAKEGIDLMVKNSSILKELSITFFGGEPLMNFPVLKQVIHYCDELKKITGKNFNYNMTTNGTIMNDEIFKYIVDHKISVMISMDGNKDMQDYYRSYESGKGSYDDIVKNIERFKEANGGKLSVRATICNPNLNIKEIKDNLSQLGFTKVYMAVVDTRKDSPLFVGEENKDILIDGYEKLAEDFIEGVKDGKNDAVGIFNKPIEDLYFKRLRVQACNAGISGFTIGTDGNIYPCHRYMGMEDYIVGNLREGIDSSLTLDYRKANVFLKEGCSDCWAKFLCGGACSNTCVTQENDIMKAPKSYCETYKGFFEIILYIYYTLKEWNKDILKLWFEKEESAL